MVMAYLAFKLPAETEALNAAVTAVEAPPPVPVLVNGAGKHAGAAADELAAVVALDDEVPEAPEATPAPTPKRNAGRPRKGAAPAAALPVEPVIAALPSVAPEVPPPPSTAPDPGAAEEAQRQELGFEAMRVGRTMSVVAMRSLLQKVGGEECMSVNDMPAALLPAAIAEFKATA